MRGAIACALAAAALGDASAAAAGPAGEIQATGSFGSPSAVFGDLVTAEVDVRFGSAVDAGSIRLGSSLLPLTATSTPDVERHAGELRIRYSLSCLTEGCLPGKGPRVLHLPPLTVTALAAGRRVTARATWPALAVTSRLSAKEQSGRLRFRSPSTPPAPRYRVTPGALAAGLIAAAAVCALAAAALIALAGLRLARRPRPQPRLSPLALAIAYVRDSARRQPPDRRRALALLSEAVADSGDPGLAGTAAQEAWSRPEPTPSAATALADRAAGKETP